MNYFKDEILRVCVIIAMLAFWVMIFCVMKASADEIDDVLPFLIQVESGGNPNAVSKAGAIGLCQVTPIVLKEWKRFNRPVFHADYSKKPPVEYYEPEWTMEDMRDWKKNIQVAEWYLRRLRDHYLKERLYVSFINTDKNPQDYYERQLFEHNITLILAAYNGGITRLKSVNYDINKMPKETQAYVKKILKNYKESNEKSR